MKRASFADPHYFLSSHDQLETMISDLAEPNIPTLRIECRRRRRIHTSCCAAFAQLRPICVSRKERERENGARESEADLNCEGGARPSHPLSTPLRASGQQTFNYETPLQPNAKEKLVYAFEKLKKKRPHKYIVFIMRREFTVASKS